MTVVNNMHKQVCITALVLYTTSSHFTIPVYVVPGALPQDRLAANHVAASQGGIPFTKIAWNTFPFLLN